MLRTSPIFAPTAALALALALAAAAGCADDGGGAVDVPTDAQGDDSDAAPPADAPGGVGDAEADAPGGDGDADADAPGGDAEADAAPPYTWVAWEGTGPVPDVATQRLCPGAATPDDLAETTFIDCALEGAPTPAVPGPAPDALVVMTWNLERGFHVDEQIAALLDDPAVPLPDVLLVSEADRGCPRTDRRHVVRDMAEALGMGWVYAVEFVELDRDDGPPPFTARTCEHGNAILSRWPLGNVRQHRHAAQFSWYFPPGAASPPHDEPRLGGRVAVIADLRVGDRFLRLYSLHLESSGEPYATPDQAVEVAEEGLASPVPVVVGGDLNAPFYFFDLQTGSREDPVVFPFLDRGYVDPHGGLPYEERVTHPPAQVLDFLFVRGVAASAPGLCPEATCGGLSDHLPVWATVALPPARPR